MKLKNLLAQFQQATLLISVVLACLSLLVVMNDCFVFHKGKIFSSAMAYLSVKQIDSEGLRVISVHRVDEWKRKNNFDSIQEYINPRQKDLKIDQGIKYFDLINIEFIHTNAFVSNEGNY